MNTLPAIPLLEVHNLSNTYEGRPLLQNINLSLKRGEILGLLGPSGSGKTTLLRIIAGLESSGQGRIVFDGKSIDTLAPHKRQIGMMFQDYALFPHKSVLQNIAFGLEMQHWPRSRKEKKIEEIISLVGLNGFENRNVEELSGGERQRVALARSLAPEPRLLLLDEPLGSLDRTLRNRLTDEIRSILKSLQVTAIFVTHDQNEAFTVADSVGILHEGILMQHDQPENLYRKPRNTTIASFLGFKNLLAGEFREQGIFHCPLFIYQPIAKPAATGHTTLLIRPDGARLKKPNNHDNYIALGKLKICYRKFHGSHYQLKAVKDKCLLHFHVAIDPPPPEKGSTPMIWIKKSALVFLPEEKGNR